MACETRRRIDIVAASSVVITVLAWGSAFAAIRRVLVELDPIELSTARYVSAGLLAALWLVWRRAPLPTGRDLVRFMLAGLIFIPCYSVLLNTGQLTVPAGPASFIINVMPVMVAIIAWLALGERFGAGGWLGTVISFAGVGLIAVGSSGSFSIDSGVLFVLAAAVCSAAGSLLQQPLSRRYGPIDTAAWVMLLGMLPLLLAAKPTWDAVMSASMPVRASLLYLVLVPTALGYVTWAIVLSRFPAARAANFLYCIPLTATFVGFLWLGEVPTLLTAIGALMALGGVVVVGFMRRRPSPEIVESKGH